MRFAKWHALGNAYVVVEQPDAGQLTPERVGRICDYERGIGSHGVVEIVRRGKGAADAEIVIWNPDGSVAEISGNGVRIAAAWYARQLGTTAVAIASGGRLVRATLRPDGLVETDMGAVVVGPDETIDIGEVLEVTIVSVGNPHAVIRRPELARPELLRIGPAVERHPRFPDRTNVQLVKPTGPHVAEALVWERGAGETPASGSSAVAIAAAAASHGWCESPVTVTFPGGPLTVELVDGNATLVGPAEFVAEGATEL